MGLAIISSFYLGIETGRLPFAIVAVMVAVAGAGVGTLFPIATVSVQNAVEPANLGIATATLTFLRSLGGAIGVAVLGSVLLSHGIAIQSIGHRLSVGAGADPALKGAFILVFFLAAGFLLAGQICLIVMREKPWRSARDPSQFRGEKSNSRRRSFEPGYLSLICGLDSDRRPQRQIFEQKVTEITEGKQLNPRPGSFFAP
jgi:MFS family permease